MALWPVYVISINLFTMKKQEVYILVHAKTPVLPLEGLYTCSSLTF